MEKSVDAMMGSQESTREEFERFANTLVHLGDSAVANPTKGERPDYSEWWSVEDPNCVIDNLLASLTQVGAQFRSVSAVMMEQQITERNEVLDALREYLGVFKTLPTMFKVHDSAWHDLQVAQTKEATLPPGTVEKLMEKCQIVSNVVLAELRHIHESMVIDFREMMRAYVQARVEQHHKMASVWEAALESL
jgi:hypothetical protein